MAVRQDASTGQLIEDGVALDASGATDSHGRQSFRAKIYSPFRTYYDDQAFSLSAVNLSGPFDILPQHHKFISLLEPCELVLDTAAGEQRVKIAGGIMHVRSNQVSILLDV